MDRSSCLLAVASLVLGFSGCTSCHHQAIRPVIEPLQNTALCGEQRSQVYTFLVNGNDPLILAELYQLRGKLNEYGFTKIYSGELFHGALFEKEIRRLHREEENPKIVLVGYSFGAGVVDGIAERLSADGLPVDVLVQLAPVYLPTTQMNPNDFQVGRRVVLNPNGFLAGISPRESGTIQVPGSGHFSLPMNPATITTIAELLNELASAVPTADWIGPSLPINDDPAPLPGQLPIGPQNLAPQGEWVRKPTQTPIPAQPIPPNATRVPQGTLTVQPKQ